MDAIEIRRLIDDGAYSSAAQAARDAMARIEKGASTPLRFAVLALWIEASLELGKGTDQECLARAAEVVSLSEREAAKPAEHARALSLLASVRLERGEVAQARPLSEKALEIRKRLLGDDDPETAESLELAASICVDEGRLADARPLYEQALRVYETKLGSAHRATAATLNQLGAVLRRQGEYGAAQALVERGLAIRREVLRPMHPEIAQSLNTLATVLLDKGQYREALVRYEEALAIRERTFGDEHPLVAQVLNNIGAVRTRLGDLAGAKLLYERALELRSRALGAEHPDVALNMNTLAATLYALGDFAGARKLYERASEIRERKLGPDHPDLATSFNNLAALLQATGDLPDAETLFRKALAIRERRLGPEHPLVAQSLQNLARLQLDQHQLREASGLLERSLEIREKALGPRNAQVAVSLSGLASLRRAEGNRADARRLEGRALEIRRAALGPEHLDVSGSYLMLGTLALEEGDVNGARAAMELALQIRERGLGEDHPQVAPPLVGLAAALARAGETQRALEAALRAEDISRRHLAVTARSLPERQALRYAATRASGLEWALSLAAREPTPSSIERVWDALVRSRALVLDEMAARLRSLAGRDTPELTPLLQAWQSARERYATLVLRGPGGEAADRYRGLVDEARRESEALERNLSEASALFRADRNRSLLGLAEIRAALPPGTALVAFARFRDHARGAALPSGKAGEPPEEYLAFLATGPTSTPRLVRLGAADSIDALIRQWRDAVSAGAPETALNRVGALLRRRVWDPVAGQLDGSELVLVVPDGAFHLLPLGALPVPDGRYLMEAGPTLHMLSAERDLVRPDQQRATGAALAVGGVAFDAGGGPLVRPSAGAGCSDLSGVRFADLPGTRSEVEDLKRVWQRSGRSGLVELAGGRATESAIRRSVEGKSLIHFATHGFFLGGNCAAAPASTRGIGGVSALQDTQPASRRLDSPLLLSGLAFAGANRRGALTEDDGVLTASEVAALDLSSVEWAVLSACDTGLGEISASEGVLGLRRAFQVAGARSIIMSAWSVDDVSTREWMRFLYDGLLLRGRATAEAVRQASLAALHARRARGESASPFFWAAFIAAGDWR